jgi:hypothetical protein
MYGGAPHPYYGGGTYGENVGPFTLRGIDATPATSSGIEWKITCTYEPAPVSDRTVRRRYELAPRVPAYVVLAWLLALAFLIAWLILQ